MPAWQVRRGVSKRAWGCNVTSLVPGGLRVSALAGSAGLNLCLSVWVVVRGNPQFLPQFLGLNESNSEAP